MKRTLGIDLGDARVGIAVSDQMGMLAHPMETIQVKSGSVVKRVLEIIKEKDVGTVVVGLPRNMDGSFGPAAQKSREFMEALKTETTCPIIPWDERLTTVSAQRSLQEAGKKAREHKSMIDQVAAQIILQSWLDSQTPLA